MFCPYMKGTGIDVQGGQAEYMLMNADATWLIPDKVSYEQGAPIFCAGYTVYGGLRWADPKPHERVAVGSTEDHICAPRCGKALSIADNQHSGAAARWPACRDGRRR
jgi:hypothetical protein